MKIRKRLAKLTILTGIMLLLGGCSGVKKELPEVNISLWCDERNVELLNEQLAEFSKLHENEARFEFSVSIEGEDTCKEVVLTDPKAAADIYVFADDQFDELYRNNALLKHTRYQDEITSNVGGESSGAMQAVTRDGEIFAVPVTAGNGYFLYYNKAYISDTEAKTLDGILEAAKKNNKKFAMDFTSGWYIYSFFKGAGLEVSDKCTWNATDTKYKGVDVAEAMLKIAMHDGFFSCADDGFVTGVEDGTVIAGVNGAWNASKVEAAWGENYAATLLPTYTIVNDQLQMCSFTGYKLMGINAYTAYPEYCMELVHFLTNEENQLKRFKTTGECPANLKAAADEEVMSSPAVSALALQSKYGYVQSVAEPYWAASSKFGIIIASGNRDNRDLQELLDDTKKSIETKD